MVVGDVLVFERKKNSIRLGWVLDTIWAMGPVPLALPGEKKAPIRIGA